MTTKTLTPHQYEELIGMLKSRFDKHKTRHKGLEWAAVEARIESCMKGEKASKLCSLYEMEKTGGEPDVVAYNAKTGEYTFYDCSAESPSGRRSLCYDHPALEARKEHKPKNSAMNMATQMGIEILTETQYRELQTLGKFDSKTSSWIQTPAAIRKLGGAVFCDFRYDTVFIYHNGAESYYAARGFRGSLKV